MKTSDFDREKHKFPLMYDPQNFQPVQYYGLTNEQRIFLEAVKEYICESNVDFYSPHEIEATYINIIDNILSTRRYSKTEINTLLRIREIYGHVYKKSKK